MRYYLWIDKQQRGPFELEELRRMLGNGEVASTVFAAPEDGSDEFRPTYLPGLVGPAPPLAADPRPYYIDQGEEEVRGPYTIKQLQSMWHAGALTGRTLYCQEGDAEWRPLTHILAELEPPAAPTPSEANVVYLSPPKSRWTYVILGLLLGTLGTHNFYAGHYRRGAWQFAITVLLGWAGLGLVITFIWALVDVFNMTVDGDGRWMA